MSSKNGSGAEAMFFHCGPDGHRPGLRATRPAQGPEDGTRPAARAEGDQAVLCGARQSAGPGAKRLAVNLTSWTLCRSGEVIGARWSEFDLDEAQWTIPAARMKKRDPHVVPLPTQAVDALRSWRDFLPNRDVVFPNAHDPRRPASHTYLNKAVTRLGFKGFTAHGIRATGSTMLHDMGFRPEIIERQLAHQERSKTKRSYNRALYLEERRHMMQSFADYLAVC
jgi:integrase